MSKLTDGLTLFPIADLATAHEFARLRDLLNRAIPDGVIVEWQGNQPPQGWFSIGPNELGVNQIMKGDPSKVKLRGG